MGIALIRQQMRAILGDQGEPFQATVVGDGATSRYELPVQFIDPAQFAAFTLDPTTQLNTPGDYALDSRNGVLLLTVPLAAGKTLVAQGMRYQEFAPEDLDIFLDRAVIEHTATDNPAPVLDPAPGQRGMSLAEQQVVAIRGVINALWALATDASMDVDIVTPDGVSIPRSQRFAQLMQLIQYWEAEYEKLATALNVGPFRVEMFDLRRVSRTTNRLVPLYRPREYDDRLPPQRVLVPIDTLGGRVITYKSIWLNTVAYKVDDVVDFLGQRYIAVADSTGQRPDLDLSGVYWQTTTINTGWYPGT